jgi:hypothetical protein
MRVEQAGPAVTAFVRLALGQRPLCPCRLPLASDLRLAVMFTVFAQPGAHAASSPQVTWGNHWTPPQGDGELETAAADRLGRSLVGLRSTIQTLDAEWTSTPIISSLTLRHQPDA